MGNSSEISNLQTELKYLDKLKCYRILSDSGVPPPWGVADGWMGVGVSMSVWGMSHACMHAHAHTRMHAHMQMHVKHSKHAKHGCLHVGGHLQFLYMYKCACVCACMCMQVRVCGDTPHALRCPPTHLPPPQSCREPKRPKFNN